MAIFAGWAEAGVADVSAAGSPDPRRLRPRLAAIADRCDPLARQLAAAMLAADAPGLHVYYVDDHFVPYEGAKPVPSGDAGMRNVAWRCCASSGSAAGWSPR